MHKVQSSLAINLYHDCYHQPFPENMLKLDLFLRNCLYMNMVMIRVLIHVPKRKRVIMLWKCKYLIVVIFKCNMVSMQKLFTCKKSSQSRIFNPMDNLFIVTHSKFTLSLSWGISWIHHSFNRKTGVGNGGVLTCIFMPWTYMYNLEIKTMRNIRFINN
jgi:hypothetical protein